MSPPRTARSRPGRGASRPVPARPRAASVAARRACKSPAVSSTSTPHGRRHARAPVDEPADHRHPVVAAVEREPRARGRRPRAGDSAAVGSADTADSTRSGPRRPRPPASAGRRDHGDAITEPERARRSRARPPRSAGETSSASTRASARARGDARTRYTPSRCRRRSTSGRAAGPGGGSSASAHSASVSVSGRGTSTPRRARTRMSRKSCQPRICCSGSRRRPTAARPARSARPAARAPVRPSSTRGRRSAEPAVRPAATRRRRAALDTGGRAGSRRPGRRRSRTSSAAPPSAGARPPRPTASASISSSRSPSSTVGSRWSVSPMR